MGIQNSKGDELSVTTTVAQELIVPVPTNVGGANLYADTLHVWNTGASDVRIGLNYTTSDFATDFTVAEGALIPAGEDHYFVNLRNPIKAFVYATESGTSTIKYSAS